MSARLPALQIVHGYNAPFFDLANQYAGALDPGSWELTTLYLTGPRDSEIEAATRAERVRFLDYQPRDLRGLKLRALVDLRRLHREFPFRLVIAHRYKAMYLALLAGLGSPETQVLGVAHAFGVMSRRGRRLLVRALRRRVYLLGVSGAVAEDLRWDCPFLERERIQALPNAVELESLEAGLLSREQARSELGLAPGDLVFVNVGRYHPDKDQATLLRGFARVAAELPEARLLVIGDGRLQGMLEAMLPRLDLVGRARILGPIPKVSRYFAAFDCYVSSSDREPFGMVLAEAMAARLPIISTDCGGAPEVVGQDGFYFGRGDDQALAGLLQGVRNLSSSERRELGERLRQRLEAEFSAAAFRRRFHELPPIRALSARGTAGV